MSWKRPFEPETSGTGGGVTDHGGLSGLSDDDHGQYQLRSERGQANGYAPLDSGLLIPRQHIPAVAITSRFVVNSQAAQLALVAEEGDVAIRTDQSRSYIRNPGTAGTMADWDELLTPTDQVQSVDGRTGVVDLSDRYTPFSHVGSTDGHPLATTTASGFQSAADKAKLAGVEAGATAPRPTRTYVSANFTSVTRSVTSAAWQASRLPQRITVPALGQPPAGYGWFIDVLGSIRIQPPAVNVSLFLQVKFNDSGVGTEVDGGGTLFANSQGALPVSSFELAPPTLTASFTVDFYWWVSAGGTGSYTIHPGPHPAAKCYLEAV